MKGNDLIGIVSWFGADNFGSNIQAAALQRVLKRMGHDAVNISMEFSPEKAGSFANALYLLASRLRKRLKGSDFSALSGSIRKTNITRFIQQETEYQIIDRHSQYPSFASRYAAFITGSDQLWNPDYINPFTTLDFAGAKKRISYATSIGTDNIPAGKLSEYKRITLYDSISVRERSAKDILAEAIGRSDICVTADPTILLPVEDYLSMAENAVLPETIGSLRPFVFCYMVGRRPEYTARVAEIANGRKVVCVSGDPCQPATIDGIRFEEAGPYEWLWLISHADCVVTDSFHAVVLSLIMNTSFYVLKRFSDTDVKSQNSRLTNLFESTGCGLQFDALISDPEAFSKAQEYFTILKESSISYLQESLNKPHRYARDMQ